MATGHPNKQWGAPDFERYHAGKMTAAEMHALEKAALEDPFLEDALEGYALTSTGTQDLDKLKERLWLTPEETETPVVWFRTKTFSQLFKAAAILIIVGGLGWLIFKNNFSGEGNKSNELASSETPSAIKEEKPAFKLPEDTVPAIAKLDDKPADKGISNINSGITEGGRSIDDAKSVQPAEADELARNQAMLKDKAAYPANPFETNAQKWANREERSAGQPSAAPATIAQSQQANNGNQPVRGRVVDQNGQAVPFATVRNATDKNQATSADAQGNFSIQNNVANAPTVSVEVNAVGYDSRQANLNNSSTNTIVLNEREERLSEVALSKSVTKSAKKEQYQWNGKNTLIKLRNATPLEGWDYFYYVMNDSIVNHHLFNKDKGKISFNFEVDSSGAVKNIIIKKSLNDTVDQAAMRILLKAPVLKINDRKKKAEAIIQFNY
ncbi:MAG: hypothetical protein EOO06_04735 [Chitinophagaceae bacterium]|nr:MAG: hypothetical protein EOO06_04735 [Chitinophagaceae bacterium]